MKKYLSFVLAVLMLLACVPAGAKTDEPTREGIGMNVAGFNARLLKSTEYYDSSSVSQHTVTIMTLWADWCPSCQGYLPIVQQMYDHYMATPEQDVQFIGAVSLTQGCTETSATNYINNHGYTWTNVVPDSILNAVFNTSAYIPQTLIIDRNGNVRDHIVGGFDTYEEFIAYIEMWLDVLENHLGETCTISYVCHPTGQVLATQEVECGCPFVPLTRDDMPELEGYTFSEIRYDVPGILETGYQHISYIAMSSCTITVIYTIKTYRVRFYDSITGAKIGQQYVQYGNPVEAPEAPVHEGYTFVGWDQDLSFISANMDVYTVYLPEGGEIGDVTGDGTVDTTDALQILRCAMGLMELDDAQLALADYNGDGTVDSSDALAILRAI